MNTTLTCIVLCYFSVAVCAHWWTCLQLSNPASSPKTARWVSGLSGAPAPKPAPIPTNSEAAAPERGRCCSFLWGRSWTVHSWRRQRPVNLWGKLPYPVPSEYFTHGGGGWGHSRLVNRVHLCFDSKESSHEAKVHDKLGIYPDIPTTDTITTVYITTETVNTL